MPGITSEDQLDLHLLRGGLFECHVITELLKKRTNAGQKNNLYFWRDKTGREIDVIIDMGEILLPIKIKAGKTINNEFFKNLIRWNEISGMKKGYLIYSGTRNQQRSNGIDVISTDMLYKTYI